jgi:hypothetical protein
MGTGLRWIGHHFFRKKLVVPIPVYPPLAGHTRTLVPTARTHLPAAVPVPVNPLNSKFKKIPLSSHQITRRTSEFFNKFQILFPPIKTL